MIFLDRVFLCELGTLNRELVSTKFPFLKQKIGVVSASLKLIKFRKQKSTPLRVWMNAVFTSGFLNC